jgi:hypothetical protein
MRVREEVAVASVLRVYTIYGFVPRGRLTAKERKNLYGSPEGAWIELARLSATSKGGAVAKAKRQAWCRDERVAKYRAEPESDLQPLLF